MRVASVLLKMTDEQVRSVRSESWLMSRLMRQRTAERWW